MNSATVTSLELLLEAVGAAAVLCALGWMAVRLIRTKQPSLTELHHKSQQLSFSAFWYPAAYGIFSRLHLSHPKDIEAILLCDRVTKDSGYEFVRSFIGQNGLLTQKDSLIHARHRKLLNKAFAPLSIREVSQHAVYMKSRQLVQTWRALCIAAGGLGSKVTTTPQHDINSSLLGAIVEILFFRQGVDDHDGCNTAASLSKDYHSVAVAFHRLSSHTSRRQQSPLPQWGSMSSEQRDSLEVVRKFAASILHRSTRRLEETSKQIDDDKLSLLDRIIAASANSEEAMDHVLTFLFAGFDTTACSLAWTLLLLAKNPSIQERLFQELVQILDKENGETLPLSQLHALRRCHLLESILKESLRLFPVAPVVYRTVSRKAVHLPHSGVDVKGGSTVALNFFSCHRCEEFFGENVSNFDPSRWDTIAEGNHKHFTPFSIGARNCIGKDLAWNELCVFVGVLIRNFVFDTVRLRKAVEHDATSHHCDASLDVGLKFHVTLATEEMFRLSLSLREP